MASGRGRANQKVLPWPISLSTPIWPPWASTASLQKVNPKPVPWWFLRSSTWPNFSKMRWWNSGAIPGPLSVTATRTSLVDGVIPMRTSPPFGVNLMALLSQVLEHPADQADVCGDDEG